MTPEGIRRYCLNKPGSWEDFPFGEDPLVVKVGSKLFALINSDTPPHISLKCDPVRATDLRGQYAGINPGYHLDKRHWITISCDDTVPDDLLRELIDHSYTLVFNSLTRSEKEDVMG